LSARPGSPPGLHAPGDPPDCPDSPTGVPAQGGLTDFGRATRGTGLHRRTTCGTDFGYHTSRGTDVLSRALRGLRGAATSLVACLPDGLHSAHRANSFDGSGAGPGSTTSVSAPTASRQRGSDATRHAAHKPSPDGHEG
jgi:hypothetical protein